VIDNASTYRSHQGFKTRFIGRVAFIVAILALAAGLALCPNFTFGDSQAYATIYPAGQQAQADEESANGSTEGTDDEANGDETEIVDDEGTPLSSGLGGGEPAFSSVGFGPIAIVGIVAVALFFLVLMRRLNTSIKDMNRMFK